MPTCTPSPAGGPHLGSVLVREGARQQHRPGRHACAGRAEAWSRSPGLHGAGGAAACDDALVSHEFAVWDGNRPLDADQAGSTYDELYEHYM